jgi:acyl-CoA thioesterase I
MRWPRGRIATSAQRTEAAPGITAFLRTGRAATAKRVVVCAGDSITSGASSANWVDLLQRRFAADGYQFVNAGVDGDPAWNVLERIEDVVRCRPDAVTLQVGGNDVAAASGTWHEKLYWRQQHVPRAPSLGLYTECVDEILTRLQSQTSARIAVLDIPMIGEDLTSDTNRRVDSYNQALRRVAAAHGAQCLPLHDRLAALLPSSHNPPPYRGRFGPMIRASVSRSILRRSWNQISASNGLVVLIDHVHLNDRAAILTSDLIAEFLTGL